MFGYNSTTARHWCATERYPDLQLPCPPQRFGAHLVSKTSSFCDLGIYIDADLSERDQIIKTTALCIAAQRKLPRSHRYLPSAVRQSLVVSLVLGWLDYGNGQLCGLPDYQYRQLKSNVNVVARSIFQTEAVGLTLIKLHWLNAVDQITSRSPHLSTAGGFTI